MAQPAFDPRIITVTLDFGNGNTQTYQDIYIKAQGVKGFTSQMGQCSITLLNLTPQQRFYILTQASPQKVPAQPILVTLQAGRQLAGTFVLFEGYTMASNSSQPPDIGITLQAVTNNLAMWIVQQVQMPPFATIQTIAEKIAAGDPATGQGKLTLDFEATIAATKKIDNFSYTGAQGKLVEKLNKLGVNAYIEGTTLVVLDIGKTRNAPIIQINAQTGMVGIPEVNTYGIKCRVMLDSKYRLAQQVEVTSIENPAANGQYMIYSMAFDIANRENAFWYELELHNKYATAGYNAS